MEISKILKISVAKDATGNTTNLKLICDLFKIIEASWKNCIFRNNNFKKNIVTMIKVIMKSLNKNMSELLLTIDILSFYSR